MSNETLAERLSQIDVRRMVVILPSALGEIVQSLPLLPVLRDRFPDAVITVVVNREFAELLDANPCLVDVRQFHRRGTAQQYFRLLRDLSHGEFDLVFDLQGLLRSGVMAAATRAPLRIGLELSREGAGLACHLTIPGTGRTVPTFQRVWRIAEELGCGDHIPRTIIAISETERGWARSQLHRLSGPILAIQPGARWITRRWPVEKFAVVASQAMRQFGFSVVLLGSRSERPLASELENLLTSFVAWKPVLNLTGQTNLKQLSAVLSAVEIVLTNDSGPMHLAAGLGTSVLGVFTCTSPPISGLLDSKNEFVSTQVSCAFSDKKQCPLSGRGRLCCMDELSTDRVCAALVRLIEKRQLGRTAA